MPYLGSYAIDDYLTFAVNTHNNKGQARDADAVPSYRVYEDETTVPILTGNMALLDGANTVGFYSERIQLTAANGFETGKIYNVYITATVQGTQGTISHIFQMPTATSSTFDPLTDTVIVSSGTITNVTNPVTVTGTVNANIVSSDNIDFTALQKTSLNAATPASVVGSVGSVTAPVVASSVTGNINGTVQAVVDGYVTVSGTVSTTVTGYVQVTGTVNANIVSSDDGQTTHIDTGPDHTHDHDKTPSHL